MADKPEITDLPPPAVPKWDEEWMRDREVFAFEFVDAPGGGKARRMYVPEAAKKRWAARAGFGREDKGGAAKNPHKFTPDVALEIISHLMVGATQGDAALAAGVTRGTLVNWLMWAEDPEKSTEELRAFAWWCNRGRSLRRCEALRRIQKLGADDWRAEAWLLERTSEEYRQHSALALENPDGSSLAPKTVIYLPEKGKKPEEAVVVEES